MDPDVAREAMLSFLTERKARGTAAPSVDSPAIAKALKMKPSLVGRVLTELREEGAVSYTRIDGWRLINLPAPGARRVKLTLSLDQLVLVEAALSAKLYEDAPDHLRNNGFALEPGVDGTVDPDDEAQTAYAELYPRVKEIEAIITAAKASKD